MLMTRFPGFGRRLGARPDSRIGNHARCNEPVPDEQNEDCADGRADKARTLIGAVPPDRLTEPGRKECARNTKDGGEYNPEGVFGPGESQRAISPATKPIRMIQIIPMRPSYLQRQCD